MEGSLHGFLLQRRGVRIGKFQRHIAQAPRRGHRFLFDPFAIRNHRFVDLSSEFFVVGLISDLAPVDRHDHDRGLLSQEDKPVQFQSIADRLRLRGEYAHATMSKRDRRVELKVSEFGSSWALVRRCLVRDGLANTP